MEYKISARVSHNNHLAFFGIKASLKLSCKDISYLQWYLPVCGISSRPGDQAFSQSAAEGPGAIR